MSFSVDVGKWARHTAPEAVADASEAVIFALFRGVIKDTPVLEGRLRANWIISKDRPSGETTEETDPNDTETLGKVVTFLEDQDLSEPFDIYLTNNLPYAYRIEYDGYSKVKAPEGMVRKNFIRITEKLKR